MTQEIERRSVREVLASPALAQREFAAARVANRAVGLLHEALNAAGMTQKQVAQALEVTEGRISQVMAGEGNIHLTTLARYLQAMGYELQLDATPVREGLSTIGRRRRRRGRSDDENPEVYDRKVVHEGQEHPQILVTPRGVPPVNVGDGSPFRLLGDLDPARTTLAVTSGNKPLPGARNELRQV